MIALMSRILSISGKYKKNIYLAFVFSFFKSMLAKMPVFLAFLCFEAFYNQTMHSQMCLWMGIGLIACVLLQTLCQNLSDRLQSASGYQIFADMRMALGKHLRHMPMGYFTEGNIGKISSVLSTDMVFIEENCMTTIANMMNYLFSQIIMIIFMCYLNVWLGLTSVIMAGIVILVAKKMERDSFYHSDIRQEQSENLTEAVLDHIEGIGIIKTYNLLGEKSAELSNNFVKSCQTSIDFEESAAPWQKRLNILYGLSYVIILALALYLNAQKMMTVPYLIGVILFVFDLFGPLKAFYGDSARLTVMNSCLNRIEDIFKQEELENNGQKHIPAEPNEKEVEFSHVHFGYGKQEVLHDISFRLKPNQMLALVGASGSGKSTIANLLTRFWDLKSGCIKIRGVDIREIPLAELMDHMSMVFQRVYLFQDTIYHNIAMARPDASKEEVIEAAKKARCYDFIMALPEGFDTIVGEGGASLSGGEKQRISIARCILKDTPLIILDEATASVDADNESYIQEAINELVKGKTLIVIAHRLNTIQSADQILVIDQGRIAESGTHQMLMTQNGIYRQFVSLRERQQPLNLKEA